MAGVAAGISLVSDRNVKTGIAVRINATSDSDIGAASAERAGQPSARRPNRWRRSGERLANRCQPVLQSAQQTVERFECLIGRQGLRERVGESGAQLHAAAAGRSRFHYRWKSRHSVALNRLERRSNAKIVDDALERLNLRCQLAGCGAIAAVFHLHRLLDRAKVIDLGLRAPPGAKAGQDRQRERANGTNQNRELTNGQTANRASPAICRHHPAMPFASRRPKATPRARDGVQPRTKEIWTGGCAVGEMNGNSLGRRQRIREVERRGAGLREGDGALHGVKRGDQAGALLVRGLELLVEPAGHRALGVERRLRAVTLRLGCRHELGMRALRGGLLGFGTALGALRFVDRRADDLRLLAGRVYLNGQAVGARLQVGDLEVPVRARALGGGLGVGRGRSDKRIDQRRQWRRRFRPRLDQVLDRCFARAVEPCQCVPNARDRSAPVGMPAIPLVREPRGDGGGRYGPCFADHQRCGRRGRQYLGVRCCAHAGPSQLPVLSVAHIISSSCRHSAALATLE